MTTQIINRMAVEIDGQGEPLIMVHGLGGTSNFYQPQLATLAGRYRVVRPDLPGSGRSPQRDDSAKLSIQSFVDAIVHVAKTLGIDRAHFAAHSLGTIVCFHLAVQHPKLVKSLALLGPLLAPPDSARQGIRDRAAKVRIEGMAAVADTILNAATSSDTRSNRPVVAAMVREILMRQDPEGYAQTAEALADAQPANVDPIQCPVLLITGDEDAIAPPANVRMIGDRIKGSRVVVLNRCGHWTALERAEEVSAELKNFYAKA